jgi:hypothetical protein
MLLLGTAQAWSIDQDENEITLQSLKEAEKLHGKKFDY